MNWKFVITLFCLTFFLEETFSPHYTSAKERKLKEAYIVIADGSKNKREAQSKLIRYKTKGAPQHDQYPQILLSNQIKGLNPGFWIVVAAIADDRRVANTLSKFLRTLNIGSYVRKVWVKDPEKLRLLIVQDLTLKIQDQDGDYIQVDLEENSKGIKVIQSCIQYIEECERSYDLTRGRSTFNSKKRAVIPFSLMLEYGETAYYHLIPKQLPMKCEDYRVIEARRFHQYNDDINKSTYIDFMHQDILTKKKALFFCWDDTVEVPEECTIYDSPYCSEILQEIREKEYRKVDLHLRKKLYPEEKKQYLEIGQAWRQYLELNCNEAQDVVGYEVQRGPEVPKNARRLCVERLTFKRTKEIKEMYSHIRGIDSDVSWASPRCTIDDKTGCIQKVYKKTDWKLNQIYHFIRKQLSSNRQQTLRKIQQTWLKYRDLSCEKVEEDVDKGVTTGPEMSINAKIQCLEKLTTERTKELKDVYTHIQRIKF